MELVTRVSVQGLNLHEGSVRESINSLYSLFGTTREILRKAGPKVGLAHDSVGGIAIAMLNNGLRPFLSKWHPLLSEWESKKASEVSTRVHERDWAKESLMRRELEALRNSLENYAEALALIAGTEMWIPESSHKSSEIQQFDVFLSYNVEDIELIWKILSRVEEQRP